jgi:WD40 repeat protein
MPEAGLDLSIIELADFMKRHELPLSSCALQVYVAGPLFAPSSTSIARGSLFLPYSRRVVPQHVITTFRPITFDAGANTYCVVVSPDGLMIAAGSKDQMIHLWDTKTRAYRVLRGHTDSVCALAFSPDGRRLVSGSKDATVRTWDLATGTEIVQLEGHRHRFAVLAVAFTCDGKRMISGSADQDIIVRGTDRYRLQDHMGPVTAVAVSPDGFLFATGSTDRTIWVRSTTTYAKMNPFVHADEVYCMAFSPDSVRLVSGCKDGTIYLWDVRTGEHRVLAGHTHSVNSVTWPRGSPYFLSASEDGTVCRWDASTGEATAVIRDLAFPITDMDAFPDGQHFVANSRHGQIHILDRGIRTLAEQSSSGVNAIKLLACSPDGALVAACGPDALLRIWGAKTGEVVGTFRGAGSYPSALAFSPESSRIIMTYGDNSQDVWFTGYDFVCGPTSPSSPVTDSAMIPSCDADGWIYISRSSDTVPVRCCWVPHAQRWTDWSSQVAWANGVLAIGTDMGGLTIMDLELMRL